MPDKSILFEAAEIIFGRIQKRFFDWRIVPFVWFSAIIFLPLTLTAERLPIKNYSVADGLLRANVFKIKQDSRGFWWFCTAEGVSRFDGYAFSNFTVADGLPERHVNDSLETKSGAIYLATDGGFVRLNPRGLANSPDNPLFSVILPDNQKAKTVNVLLEDESGAVWAGTSDGLDKLTENDALEPIDLGAKAAGVDGIFVNTIIKDQRGALWIGTGTDANDAALIRLRDGQFEVFPQRENPLIAGWLRDLSVDSKNRLWIADTTSGVRRLDDANADSPNFTNYTTAEGSASVGVSCITEDAFGRIYIGSGRESGRKTEIRISFRR